MDNWLEDIMSLDMNTVEAGETMFRVAQKHGVKVDQIKEWNNLTETGVKAGQQLKIKKQ